MKNPTITKQDPFEQDSMTLRDYFAAKAMQGMLMNPNITNEMFGSLDDDLVFLSYEYADEMLKKRSINKDQ